MARVLMSFLVGFTVRNGRIATTRKEKLMAETRIRERRLGKHYCAVTLVRERVVEIATAAVAAIAFIAAAAVVRKGVERHYWS